MKSELVRAVGFEPTIPWQDGGFKDRCVFQFHHARILAEPRYLWRLDRKEGSGASCVWIAEPLVGPWWPAYPLGHLLLCPLVFDVTESVVVADHRARLSMCAGVVSA